MEPMIESSPSRQRQLPCETNKRMCDEAVFVASLLYLLTYWKYNANYGTVLAIFKRLHFY